MLSGEIFSTNPLNTSHSERRETKPKDKERAKEEKRKDRSKARLGEQLSESTRRFALATPREKLRDHPRVLDEADTELFADAAQLRAELADLRVELSLLVRTWHEEFQVPDSAKHAAIDDGFDLARRDYGASVGRMGVTFRRNCVHE